MAVVATGFFDGVHLGHRQVIQTLVSSARQKGEEAIVVTFAQHPRAVLQQDARELRLLNSPQEKEALLRALGVDRVEVLPFDRAFARLTAEQYVRTVLQERLGATRLVLGYDNRLGSDRLTPDLIAPLAQSLGLEVVIVPPAVVAGVVESAAASPDRSHPRLRKREGPADEVGGRGPATPDVWRGWLPRSEAAMTENTDYQIISEEGEYSDSIYETVVMDTNGLCCAHSETSFDYGVEITVESDGEKYSGYWWDASSHRSELDAAACGRAALARAVAQIGSEPAPSGRYTAVIDAEMASKMVSPLLRALSGYSIQQNNSFLMDSLGQQRFPEGLTILDVPRIPGQTCSKYFDSEGVATAEAPIIERGVVREYFINTYMANKMGMAPTIEDATRPKVLPWPEAGLDRDAILRRCGSGILVTDFNGGNSNPVTGDFSYGIEGYLFEEGRIVRPVSGMLMTGNFLELWSRLVAAGDDARPCQTKLVPTLAFAEVDFSG